MKKLLTTLASGSLLLSVGVGYADEHEGEDAEPNVATPMEIYTCKYNEGKGPADLDAATKKFNKWADKQGITITRPGRWHLSTPARNRNST